MILVKKDAEWPLVRERDAESQMWKPVEASLNYVVANGVVEWMRKSGEPPTDVIFGRKASTKLREEFAQYAPAAIKLALPDDDFENTYHGLTFHRDRESEGVILLTRGPAQRL